MYQFWDLSQVLFTTRQNRLLFKRNYRGVPLYFYYCHSYINLTRTANVFLQYKFAFSLLFQADFLEMDNQNLRETVRQLTAQLTLYRTLEKEHNQRQQIYSHWLPRVRQSDNLTTKFHSPISANGRSKTSNFQTLISLNETVRERKRSFTDFRENNLTPKSSVNERPEWIARFGIVCNAI